MPQPGSDGRCAVSGAGEFCAFCSGVPTVAVLSRHMIARPICGPCAVLLAVIVDGDIEFRPLAEIEIVNTRIAVEDYLAVAS